MKTLQIVCTFAKNADMTASQKSDILSAGRNNESTATSDMLLTKVSPKTLLKLWSLAL
jgi:hypothetical protein